MTTTTLSFSVRIARTAEFEPELRAALASL